MCRRVVVWRVVCARSYAVVSMAVSVTRLSALSGCECGVVVAVCAVACLSVRVSPSRGGDVAYPSVSCDVVVCYVVSCRAVLCRVLWVSTRRGMRGFARGYVVSFRT